MTSALQPPIRRLISMNLELGYSSETTRFADALSNEL